MMRRLLITLLLFACSGLAAAEPGAGLAAAQDAAAATRALQPTIGLGSVVQVFVALLFVVVLIVVTAWLLRRFSGGTFARNGALKMLAGIQVGQRERIVLVQAGEVQLLLGVAPGAVRTLHQFDKPVLVDAAEGRGAERFAERLMSAMNSKKEGQS